MALAYVDGVYTHFPRRISVEFLEDLDHNAGMYIEDNILYFIKENPLDKRNYFDLRAIIGAQGRPRLYDLIFAKAIAFSNQVICFVNGRIEKYMAENDDIIGYQSGFLYYKRDGQWFIMLDKEEMPSIHCDAEYFWPSTSIPNANMCYTPNDEAFSHSLSTCIGKVEVSYNIVSGHKLVKIGPIVTQIICPDGRSANTELHQDAEVINVESNERSLIVTYQNGERRLHNRCCSYRNPIEGARSDGYVIDDNVRLNKFTNIKSARN